MEQKSQEPIKTICEIFSKKKSLESVSLDELAIITRFSLGKLSEMFPGKTVEIRVIPFGCTQVLDGVAHKRGELKNYIQLEAIDWLKLLCSLDEINCLMKTGKITHRGQGIEKLNTMVCGFQKKYILQNINLIK